MADVKVGILQRDSTEVDSIEEISPSSDVILGRGLKVPVSGGDMQLTDDANGTITLTDTAKVKISSNDTTRGFLNGKLVEGTAIDLVELNDGSNETLRVDLDINELTAETTLDGANDYLVMYDASASAHKKVLLNSFSTGVPSARNWDLCGAISNVNGNTTVSLTWGAAQATSGPSMLRAGEIIGFSLASNTARTGGTMEVMIVKNGVAQNGVGQTFFINAANPLSNSLVFATPISVAANDIIGIQVVTVGFTPSGSADIVGAFWGRDT